MTNEERAAIRERFDGFMDSLSGHYRNDIAEPVLADVDQVFDEVQKLQHEVASLRTDIRVTLLSYHLASKQPYDEDKWDEFCVFGEMRLLRQAIGFNTPEGT